VRLSRLSKPKRSTKSARSLSVATISSRCWVVLMRSSDSGRENSAGSAGCIDTLQQALIRRLRHQRHHAAIADFLHRSACEYRTDSAQVPRHPTHLPVGRRRGAVNVAPDRLLELGVAGGETKIISLDAPIER